MLKDKKEQLKPKKLVKKFETKSKFGNLYPKTYGCN